MNAGNAPRLSRVPHTGTWYRAVAPRFVSTAIVTTHSKTSSSRYSSATPANAGFEVLYLAENHLVAMFEAEALFGSPLTPGGVIAHPTVSLVTVAIQVLLTAIVDVSDPAQAALIDSNAQELTGDWRGYQLRSSATSVVGPTKAPTQDFDEQLFATCSDVQGILTLSTRIPYYRTLAVFPERLRKGIDYIRCSITDRGGQTQTFQVP